MKTCPRCEQPTMRDVEVENALSRLDNNTYICSECGNEEAFLDSGLATYLSDEKAALNRTFKFAEKIGVEL